MTKKTASKTSAKPAARAPRSSDLGRAGNAAVSPATSSAGARGSRASSPPSGAARTASGSKTSAAKKPAARAGAKGSAPSLAGSGSKASAAKTRPTSNGAMTTAEPSSTAPRAIAPASGVDAGGVGASGGVGAPGVGTSGQDAAANDTRSDVARTEDAPRGGGGAGDLADRIVEATDTGSVTAHAEHLMSDKPTTATGSARVLEELLARKPEMLVPVIDKLVHVVTTGPKRSVQTAAAALPVMARLAPARVARHLPMLTERFAQSSDIGKDGLVSTFAALCTASVAYQKRLEPVLELALSSADPKTLQRWTEIVLPSLKGEPHARARAVVEDRLNVIPRQLAQPIATFLGIKLRPASR